jgi:hypothetical protein
MVIHATLERSEALRDCRPYHIVSSLIKAISSAVFSAVLLEALLAIEPAGRAEPSLGASFRQHPAGGLSLSAQQSRWLTREIPP